MADLDPRVQELLDKQEIHDLLMRYCRGVDRGDRDLIAGVYYPDAVDDHGDFVVDGEHVADLFVRLVNRSPKGGMHFIGNQLIEVEGDTAFAESYFLAIKDIDRDGRAHTRVRAGRYVDRLERRDGRWAIAERVVVDEWNRVDAVREAMGGPEKYRFGTRDGRDPVFSIRRGRVARHELSDLSAVGGTKL